MRINMVGARASLKHLKIMLLLVLVLMARWPNSWLSQCRSYLLCAVEHLGTVVSVRFDTPPSRPRVIENYPIHLQDEDFPCQSCCWLRQESERSNEHYFAFASPSRSCQRNCDEEQTLGRRLNRKYTYDLMGNNNNNIIFSDTSKRRTLGRTKLEWQK